MDNENIEIMDDYPGIILEDRYELIKLIGSGGMAVVYQAVDNRLHRQVAVKIMRPELAKNEKFRLRFQNESQAIAKLSHPNIVGVYDVSRTESIEYIVMELAEGITLKKYMNEHGPLDTNTALSFSEQIAAALSHAHSKGIIHRDIKPQNIIVIGEDTIKVADFGIADLQSEMPNVENEAIGSVHYISPEQARGLPADERSDIYSLGIVMYEMLSGQLPFDGDDDRTIALKHLSSVPTPLREIVPTIPEEFAAIVMKAMEPALEKRYQSADELSADLEKLSKRLAGAMEEVGGNVAPVSSLGEMSRESYLRRRRRAKTVSTLSGIFGVMAFIMVLGIFLWNYLLKDIFSPGQRITIPNFVGSSYETIINSKNFNGSFNFVNVTYEIDPNVEKGIIIHQEPEAGKSYMLSDRGIDVSLTISTGVMLTEIPDLVGRNYREASTELERLGFVVVTETASSDDIEVDCVVDVYPSAGEKLPAGATVHVYVSVGPEVKTVIMPTLIGMTQHEAETLLEAYNLTLMPISEVYNDTIPAGCVVAQTVLGGTEIEVRHQIWLQVSLGPEPTPTPAPTATPEPVPVYDMDGMDG